MRLPFNSKNVWIFLIILISTPIILFFTKTVFAVNYTPIIGEAIVMSTGGRIYFNDVTYSSNTEISDPDIGNSNIRTITGYAWSEDFGWIRFTALEGENTGVTVDYTTGAVTGQAYAMGMNTLLDFTGSNSSVSIDTTTGDFTGYLWSQDFGWIEFPSNAVMVKDTNPPTNVTTLTSYTDASKVKEITDPTLYYNFSSPFFEWTGAGDLEQTAGYASGIGGYYVYFGVDDTAISSSSGTYQTASNFTPSSLVTGNTYYLRIQAVDRQGNIYTGEPTTYTFGQYLSDLEAPKNVNYVITANNNFAKIEDIFFNWPSQAPAASDDSASGVLGWQYSINDVNSWTGTVYDQFLEIDYIPFAESTFSHYLTTQKDGSKIVLGNNIIYVRTVDKAGNVSSHVSGGVSYSGEAPWFDSEDIVTVTPQTNTSNEYSLSWPGVNLSEGRELTTYYYMVNTTPPNDYNTLVNNSSLYVPITGTSVNTQMLRGSVKGSNTVYVVAVDNEYGYSSTNKISGSYTLDSTLPDPVRNLTVSDSSIKEAKLWRGSLSWEEPLYKGNGNITYEIERSLDGDSWTEIGTTQGDSYTDIVATSKEYFYRVGTHDSTDSSIANPTYSATVSETLEGRYTEAAELISMIQIDDISTRLATISWVTAREADSRVAYGISTGEYFEEEVSSSEQVTDHILRLHNLEPDTNYYAKVMWTDTDGNLGQSQEVTFRTDPKPEVDEFKIDRIGLNYAMLSFTTSGASKASVLYGTTLSYGGIVEINTSPSTSSYTVSLNDLKDGTTYNYKIRLTDVEGYIYDSLENHTFVTPPMPKVSNVYVEEIVGVASPTVLFEWQSNTKISSIITYYPLNNKENAVDKVDLTLTEGKHTMEISGLIPETEYGATVEGVDSLGNKAVSDEVRFTTATDTRPPEILNIRVEGTVMSTSVQTDRNRSAQLIVRWETDEPATSRVEYREGSGDSYNNSTQTETEKRTKHVVIISGLTPSKVYNLNIISSDEAGNIREMKPVISITPKTTDTVFDKLLGSFLNIFEFLR